MDMRTNGRFISSSWFITFASLAACAQDATPPGGDTAATEAELASSGGTVWVKEVDGPAGVTGVAPGPSSDDYVAGVWRGELRWDGALVAQRDELWEAPFIARLSPINGRPVWLKAPTEVGIAGWIEVGSEPGGDLVAAGRVYPNGGMTTMDLGCGAMFTTHFWARLDADGNCEAMNDIEDLEPRGYEIAAAAPFGAGGAVIAGTLYGRVRLPDGTEVAPPPGYSVTRGAAMVVAFDDADTVRFVHVFAPASGTMGTRGAGDGAGLAVDGAGNIHVVGTLYQPLTVNGVALDPPAPGGINSAWLVVFDEDGEVVRAGVFGDTSMGTAVAVAADGTAVIGGSFAKTITFPGGVSDTTPGETYDGFVAKLAPDGNARWMRQLWGSAEVISVDGVSIDVNGFVGVAGMWHGGTLHIHPDVYSSVGFATRAFVARLGTNTGSTVWSGTFYSGSGVFVRGLSATTNRRLTVVGEFIGIATFSDRGPFFDDDNDGAGFVARMMP